MLTKGTYVFASILCSVLLSSCVMSNAPIVGMFYSEAGSSLVATTNSAASKKGTACTKGVLGVVWGDSTQEAAMKDGNITKISYVDYTYENVLFVYAKHCTIVRGE